MPNIHVWADPTSVTLLLRIHAGALPWRGGGHHLSGRNGAEECGDWWNIFSFCLKWWTDRCMAQHLVIMALWSQVWTWSWAHLKSIHMRNSMPVPDLTAPQTRLQAHGSLCQTGVMTPREASEATRSSNVTCVWSRHRNPLALKKLPPSLCLTSNGAFLSSLSFFMFVCKVLYITWIYYAHILPSG